MKSLDEVIEAETICSRIDEANCSLCPYKATAKGWCEEKDVDVLQHLLDYKRLLTNIERNTPLEWKEIEKMVGQPVWIEGTNGKMWGIIAEVYKDMLGSGKMTLRTKNMHRLHLNEKNISVTWNAYRMERKEWYVNEYL